MSRPVQNCWIHLLSAAAFMASCRPTKSMWLSHSHSNSVSLMDSSLWEPAGEELSTQFQGTDAGWLKGSVEWTLPGMTVPRETVMHQGKRRPNHMQFSVKTKRRYKAFRMRLSFLFQDEGIDGLEATWLGNSGVVVFGLYEVQIFKTGFFQPKPKIRSDELASGRLLAQSGPFKIDLPLNQFLCGAIYGGGKLNDPTAGAPQFSDGTFANLCADVKRWHELIIEFKPALMDQSRKVANATIAVTLDGVSLFYGQKQTFELLAPTGSQQAKAETADGVIVLQDHGSRVSFKDLSIEEI